MKNQIKKLTAIALAAASAVTAGALAVACGDDDIAGFVDGPEYVYREIPATGSYEFTGNPISSVVPDDGIKIDGVFDEAFYEGKNWFKGNKITASNETGTMEVTTHFTVTGILVAARVRDSRPAVHSSWVETGNITCFNCYFAFGDAKEQTDGLYEIECTAGNRFKISQFLPTGIKTITPSFDQMPVHEVKREGDIKAGTCYNYNVEYFMPYSLFGRSERPSSVYLSPTMISSSLDDNGNYLARTWYNFSSEQISPNISGWGKVNQGIKFDYDGFVGNKITIDSTGGTVSQIYGNDWCIAGDIVKFNVAAESGKTLTSLKVNGVENKDAVNNGELSVLCNGDIEITANFS